MNNPLQDRIIEAFDGMSGQLQVAARFMLDRPREVALLSMREMARQADVKPATMTRLAKYLGFDGYDAFRDVYAAAMRDGGLGFSRRADEQVEKQKLDGDQALAAQMAVSTAAQLKNLTGIATLDQFTAAAATLSDARRIYCLGMRSSFPVAWHFHYILSLVQDDVHLLDGGGATGIDMLRYMSADDVLLAVSVQPYTRASVEIVDHAVARGLKVIAITDSPVAPVAEAACQLIRIETASPSFLHTMTPALAAAEILAALVTGRGGEKALAALRRTEGQLAAFDTHLDNKRRRKSL